MRYWKSSAAESEFAKYHLPYPSNEFQDDWDRHTRKLENDKSKIDRITQMRRIKIGQDLEFITYTHILSGHDELGSYWEKGQAEVGTYPLLRPQNVREFIPEENRYETVTKSYSEEISYWIPFTKENIDKLHPLCNDTPNVIAKQTAYSIMPEGGTQISINKFEDWANGDFDELYEYGEIIEQEEQEVKPKKKA